MNDHAGWGRDGKCTSCGTDDPRGPCGFPVTALKFKIWYNNLDRHWEALAYSLPKTLVAHVEGAGDPEAILGWLLLDLREKGYK